MMQQLAREWRRQMFFKTRFRRRDPEAAEVRRRAEAERIAARLGAVIPRRVDGSSDSDEDTGYSTAQE